MQTSTPQLELKNTNNNLMTQAFVMVQQQWEMDTSVIIIIIRSNRNGNNNHNSTLWHLCQPARSRSAELLPISRCPVLRLRSCAKNCAAHAADVTASALKHRRQEAFSPQYNAQQHLDDNHPMTTHAHGHLLSSSHKTRKAKAPPQFPPAPGAGVFIYLPDPEPITLTIPP